MRSACSTGEVPHHFGSLRSDARDGARHRGEGGWRTCALLPAKARLTAPAKVTKVAPVRRRPPPRLAAQRALPNDPARPPARRRPSRSAGPEPASVMAEPYGPTAGELPGPYDSADVGRPPLPPPGLHPHIQTFTKGSRDANHPVLLRFSPLWRRLRPHRPEK